MTQFPMDVKTIRENLQKRIDENTAELTALKQVQINTKHNSLTNRAITGEGARIGDYIGIGKALYVAYSVQYKDGHTRYMSRNITAYSYYDGEGEELGTEGFTRISRTITPLELDVILQDVKDGLASTIGELKAEYRSANKLADKRNKLVEQINQFNNSVSYASEAQL